jgi:hypothetical protein
MPGGEGLRRAAEKDRSGSRAPCIHCDKTIAHPPTSSKEGGARSDAFDFNGIGDVRTVVSPATGLASPFDNAQEVPDYDFLFSTSKDEFLPSYDASFIADYTNDASENSLSEPELVIDLGSPANTLPTAAKKCDGEKEIENQQRLSSSPSTPVHPTARTSLHLGAGKGHVKIVSILLNSGAAIESLDFAGRTALHCAVESRQVEVVRLLLDHGADAQRKDASGMSALHLAVDQGYEDIVLALIEKGVDPNT